MKSGFRSGGIHATGLSISNAEVTPRSSIVIISDRRGEVRNRGSYSTSKALSLGLGIGPALRRAAARQPIYNTHSLIG